MKKKHLILTIGMLLITLGTLIIYKTFIYDKTNTIEIPHPPKNYLGKGFYCRLQSGIQSCSVYSNVPYKVVNGESVRATMVSCPGINYYCKNGVCYDYNDNPKTPYNFNDSDLIKFCENICLNPYCTPRNPGNNLY